MNNQERLLCMVWYETTEMWIYFDLDEDFSKEKLRKLFPDGYVAYLIEIDNEDMILSDDFKESNTGKYLTEVYPNRFFKENTGEKYILFTCDEWKSYASRSFVGVTGNVDLLKSQFKRMLDAGDIEFNRDEFNPSDDWTVKDLDIAFEYVSIEVADEDIFY